MGVLTQPLFADVEIAPHLLHAVKEATTALEGDLLQTKQCQICTATCDVTTDGF